MELSNNLTSDSLKKVSKSLDKIDVSQDELNVKVHPEVKYFEQSIEVMG